MNRDTAYAIVTEHVKNEGLVRHMLSVEAAMRYYAARYGEDPEPWGQAGLLHDFDWEIHPTPDLHPEEGSKILEKRGVPQDIRYAILCHAPFLGLEYTQKMDRAIFAVDELSGFITACALVKPDKSLSSIEPASVRKKMKAKAFAASVDRDDLLKGAVDLGVDFDEHILFVAESLKPVAGQLGLNP